MSSNLQNHRCASSEVLLSYTTARHTILFFFFLFPVLRQYQCQQEISPEHQTLTIQQRYAEALSTESVLFYFMLDDPVRRISMP